MKRCLSVMLLLALHSAAFAQLKLARLFSDHVVLQRQKPIPVWGWAAPNENVKVTLNNLTQSAKADDSGKWIVKFSAMEAGGPYQLSASAKSGNMTVNDILIGEVWLCSGQSNMEWRVAQANNYIQEKQNADYPKIRHFFVDHEVMMTPQADLKSGEWKVCSSETVGNFTAVGFF
ncbi:MAG TPA: sialate O-acetylesterase, partial [Emticicia sp.]